VELIKYLNENFYTKQELLDNTKISEQDFVSFQESSMMPKCSYKLNLSVTCDSFFGLHKDEREIEYYAKGYASWLAVIQSLNSPESVYSAFSDRYIATINNLKAEGHSSTNAKISSELSDHIKDEWEHFLSGIYGLCTQSGLPEDIAAKEFAIIQINELSDINELTTEQVNKLTLAVNLLDKASSQFAPHERLKSSRHRLVNEVRRKHQLLS